MQPITRRVLVASALVAVAAGGWAASTAMGPKTDATTPIRQPLTETLPGPRRSSATGDEMRQRTPGL